MERDDFEVLKITFAEPKEQRKSRVIDKVMAWLAKLGLRIAQQRG